jgi:hypothetical protein
LPASFPRIISIDKKVFFLNQIIFGQNKPLIIASRSDVLFIQCKSPVKSKISARQQQQQKTGQEGSDYLPT